MTLWVLLAAAAILGVAACIVWVRRRNAADVWSLAPTALLSPRERELHRLLLAQYPEHQVFVKVTLSQLVAALPDTSNRDTINRHLQQQIVPFVLCRADYSVMAVIEMSEGSRLTRGLQPQESKTAKALHSAGLRLVRIPPGPLPEGSDLQLLIEGDGYFFLSPTVRDMAAISGAT